MKKFVLLITIFLPVMAFSHESIQEVNESQCTCSDEDDLFFKHMEKNYIDISALLEKIEKEEGEYLNKNLDANAYFWYMLGQKHTLTDLISLYGIPNDLVPLRRRRLEKEYENQVTNTRY